MAGVEIRHLSKRFGQVNAVDDVDLSIREGEFLVLLGPSGCGKTTLLRMNRGLERPTAARFSSGRAHGRRPPRARGSRWSFRVTRCIPTAPSPATFSSFKPRSHRVATRRDRREGALAAEMSALGPYLDRFPDSSPAAKRQRVALCRAVVRDPKVFCSTSPRQPRRQAAQHRPRRAESGFQRRIKTTTVYVTHDQVEAMGLGDRIAVMDRGKVRQVGTPQQVYEEPVDTFVATFVRQPPMNLVDCKARCSLPTEALLRAATSRGRAVQSFPFAVAARRIPRVRRYVYARSGTGAGDDADCHRQAPGTVGTTIPEGERWSSVRGGHCTTSRASGGRRR